MSTVLVAVLVEASATVENITEHLATPMRVLMPGVINRYRLGGAFTGAWDRDYDPRTDPANWRPCDACSATKMSAGQLCPVCRDAQQRGRRRGTVLVDTDQWKAHPGDIVALTTLLAPSWQFPMLHPDPRTGIGSCASVPGIFVDRTGHVWIAQAADGATPHALQEVWRSLLAGARAVAADGGPFDPSQWSIAVVEAHYTSDEDRATLPVVGSVVQITDADWVEDDAGPDQWYLVGEDVDQPFYQLVRIGGYGPTVPGYAITEIDPARIVLQPAAEGAQPYRDELIRQRPAATPAS